ncbi:MULTISPECIES: DNA polymerase I [Dehalococcoides]|uniref:DNA polymerase I n=1 Tax=Dehalococcoides TaxID=61434 RepID=UPI0002B76D7D|nr:MULTISPECIES: DNA polymerase I [Dehalococcoides]AGG06847.1 DNA polymerase I [Dehalococcoides mccartyi DCMB5]
MSKPVIVLFDGTNLVHRAYHVLPPLTVRKTGEVVGAAFGFASILIKVLTDLKPDCYAISFDKKGPTFRHEMFKDYKAQRPPMPDELVSQLGRVRQIVDAFNMPVYEQSGFEADDVLGTLATRAAAEGMEVIIASGDADSMQLVSPDIRILYPGPAGSFSNTSLYDEAAVRAKYGLGPEHVADYKALMGDPSDNIPGVPGIGPKTAQKLIEEYGGIEDIYKNLDKISPPGLQKKLADNAEVARQSKILTTIVCDLPLDFSIQECRSEHYNRQKVVDLFRELEFFRLIHRLPGGENPGGGMTDMFNTPQKVETRYIVANGQNLDSIVKRLTETKELALAVSGTSEEAIDARLTALAISPAEGEAYFISAEFIGSASDGQMFVSEGHPGLIALLTNKNITKTAHNAKYLMNLLASAGQEIQGLDFDTMLSAHLLGEKNLGIKDLVFEHFGVEIADVENILTQNGKKKSFSASELSEAAQLVADYTFRLKGLFAAQLAEINLIDLFVNVEMPLVPILLGMERSGIMLDTDLLKGMAEKVGGQIFKLEEAIYAQAGHSFNIGSPQQLGRILFDELKLPVIKKTKTGYSTGAEVLDELKGEHRIVDLILEYRMLVKLKSTYLDTLPRMVNPHTRRLHTSFNQTRTATGRLSSSEPNLQNIPVRGEMGREIRRAFIAPKGTVMLAGDYSQIDLRVLAHLSGDPALIEAFLKDQDIHTATAARLLNILPSEVTKEQRRLAKTVNFGVIYGMSSYGLEQATELSLAEADKFIKAYFEKYPRVAIYFAEIKHQARTNGYVETLLGRRRYIPEINSPNRILRESAERMAINMPVQGTSADIIKLAMVRLDEKLKEEKLESRLLLQVHDELIFEVPDAELKRMSALLMETMSGAVTFEIPLKVELKSGANWGDME